MKKKMLVLVAVTVLLLVASLAIAAGMRTGSDEHSSARSVGRSGNSDALPATGELGTSTRNELGRSPGTSGKRADTTEPMTRAVVSTGQVTAHPEAIDRARSEVLRLVEAWQGTVAEEETHTDDRGRISDATMTLRVPTSRFDAAMNALGGLGGVEQQSRSSQDVTTRVLDNDARVRAAERSIRRLETLLGRAERLGDVIAIESELARRQADLDSLKSQQDFLSDQSALSTITVYLSRTSEVLESQQERGGFLAGLKDGWAALAGTTTVLLTVIGAVLPFAMVLLLLGVPVWLVVRRKVGASRRN